MEITFKNLVKVGEIAFVSNVFDISKISGLEPIFEIDVTCYDLV